MFWVKFSKGITGVDWESSWVESSIGPWVQSPPSPPPPHTTHTRTHACTHTQPHHTVLSVLVCKWLLVVDLQQGWLHIFRPELPLALFLPGLTVVWGSSGWAHIQSPSLCLYNSSFCWLREQLNLSNRLNNRLFSSTRLPLPLRKWTEVIPSGSASLKKKYKIIVFFFFFQYWCLSPQREFLRRCEVLSLSMCARIVAVWLLDVSSNGSQFD